MVETKNMQGFEFYKSREEMKIEEKWRRAVSPLTSSNELLLITVAHESHCHQELSGKYRMLGCATVRCC